MPIKKNKNPFTGKAKPVQGKKKTSGKRVGKSVRKGEQSIEQAGEINIFKSFGHSFISKLYPALRFDVRVVSE